MENTVKNNTVRVPYWVHSTRCLNSVDEHIVVKEKVAYIDNDTKDIEWKDELNIISNPKRNFYIHQKRYQNYQYKIEYAKLEECDRFTCYNKELEQSIKQQLGIFSNKRMTLRELCNSPYLYGADIDIEVLIKIKYLKHTEKYEYTPPITFASFDLEASVIESDNRIMLASICIDRVIHCVILDSFLYKPGEIDPSTGYPKRIKATLDDFVHTVNTTIGDYLEKFNLSVEYYLVHSEIELILQMMKIIHASKVDFCGAWNMPYDIPKIIERVRFNKYNLEDVFCHPDVPRYCRYVKYRPDFSHTDHFTDSWDWMNCTGHTQYMDSMRLYSRLRKVKGREPSYGLGVISRKVIGHDKLDIGGSHWYNQLYNFLGYGAYNIVDAGNVWLMEEKNHDISSMCGLVGNSLLKSFSKQTIMLKNDFYQYCLDRGLISGTVGENMGTPYDDLLGKAGGTVLSPYLIRDAGLRAISMRRNLHTLLYIFIKDIDAASMYPYTTKAFNISKEACRATMVALQGMKEHEIEELYTAMIAPREHTLLYGKKFFNLPLPSELVSMYQQWFYDRQSVDIKEMLTVV